MISIVNRIREVRELRGRAAIVLVLGALVGACSSNSVEVVDEDAAAGHKTPSGTRSEASTPEASPDVASPKDVTTDTVEEAKEDASVADGSEVEATPPDAGQDASNDVAADRVVEDHSMPPDATVLDARDAAEADPIPSTPDAADATVEAACPVYAAPTRAPSAAASWGFSGTAEQYRALYDVPCTEAGANDACINACRSANGSEFSCQSSAWCVAGIDDFHCVPPQYWDGVTLALAEDDRTAQLTLAAGRGFADSLILSGFGLQVPAEATIVGMQFDIRRATDTADSAADDSVRIMLKGQPVGDDRARRDELWSSTLGYVAYGGPTDTWQESSTPTRTPADVNDPSFGISISARFTQGSGVAYAGIDSVRATVYYRMPCH